MSVKKYIRRVLLTVIGRKGVYGYIGKHNRFSKGVLVYENARLGSYNYFSPYALVNNAVIHNYCSIGPGCKIGLGEHDFHMISTCTKVADGTGRMSLFDKEKPAIIEDDVWLGANVVVKQGIKISVGAVVGANAVVTHDVPAYAIAVGVPARIIGYRFDSGTIDKITSSRWYEQELDDAKKTVSQMRNEIYSAEEITK